RHAGLHEHVSRGPDEYRQARGVRRLVLRLPAATKLIRRMERIQDALLRAAATSGARDALIVDGTSTSYADLVRGVGAVALYLKRAGMKAGDRVAFESKSKLVFVQTFFGIVSAGGVAVPIAEGAAGQT